MADPIFARQRQIVGTADDWDANDLVLGAGELALVREADGTVRARVGDGGTPFSASPYLTAGVAPFRYKGNADPTDPPPADAAPGDVYTASPGGVVDASWGPPAAGTTVDEGDFLILDADGNWNVQAGGIDVSMFVTEPELGAPGGSAMVGFVQEGAGAVPRTVQERFADAVSIADFGADPALADNSAAILAALAASQAVYIPNGGFGCAGDVVKAQIEGQTLFGPGVLFLNSGATGNLFSSNGKTVHIAGVGFEGSGGGSQVANAAPTADRNALALDMDKASTLSGVRINGFANNGVCPINAAPSRLTNLRSTGLVVSNCWTGLKIGEAVGEYTTWANCSVTGCRMGVEISSGNVSWVGGRINDNYRNVYLLGTGVPNNGHGSIVGALINHAVESLIFGIDIDIGFAIIACQLFDGEVSLLRCAGVEISDCTADATFWRFGGAGYNRVCHNTIIGGYANTVQLNNGGTISPTELFENYKPDGTLFTQRRAPVRGNSIFIAGDQRDRLWSENGSLGTDGVEFTSNGGTGLQKAFAFTASARAAVPFYTLDRLAGAISQMMLGLPSYADDAAAAAAGVPVKGAYLKGGLVAVRLV